MERSGPMSHWPGLLLATGTEDYFDDAYTFESTLDERPGQHTFYSEDAVCCQSRSGASLHSLPTRQR